MATRKANLRPAGHCRPLPAVGELVDRTDVPADSADSGADLLEPRWEVYPVPVFRYVPPSIRPAGVLTFEDSVDLLAHRHLTRLGLHFPWWPATDTPPLTVSASVGDSEDLLVQAHRAVQDVAVSAKVMLPEVLHAWYLKADACANTEPSEQAGLSVGTVLDLNNGTQLAFSLGMARQQAPRRPHKRAGSNVVKGDLQWTWSERVGLGIRLNYYPDLGGMDALMSLRVQSSVRP